MPPELMKSTATSMSLTGSGTDRSCRARTASPPAASPGVADLGVDEAAAEAERRGAALVRELAAGRVREEHFVRVFVERVVGAEREAPLVELPGRGEIERPLRREGLVLRRRGVAHRDLAEAHRVRRELPVVGAPERAEQQLVARGAYLEAADLDAAEAQRGRVDRGERRGIGRDAIDLGLVVVVAEG